MGIFLFIFTMAFIHIIEKTVQLLHNAKGLRLMIAQPDVDNDNRKTQWWRLMINVGEIQCMLHPQP